MAFFIPLIAGIASAAVGAGLSAALSPDMAGAPSFGAATRGAAKAEADTLAAKRMVEYLARMGGKGSVEGLGADQQPIYETRQFVSLPAWRIPKAEWDKYGLPKNANANQVVDVPYNEADWKQGGRFYSATWQAPHPFNKEVITGYGPPKTEVDFTGIGEIDMAKDYADKMAKALLENQQKYGVDFVKVAKEQLEQSDPEGTAARKQLADMVMADLDRKAPQRPVASELSRQLLEDLNRPGISAAQASAAGQGGGGTDIDALIAEINAANETASRMGDQQRMMGWLSSGATPQDVEYRRNQQAMANAASFLGGKTPQAQFGQLSGAQQGASPFVQGPALSNIDSATAGSWGPGAAGTAYGNQLQQQASQLNPWFVGLSSVIQGAGALGAASNKN